MAPTMEHLGRCVTEWRARLLDKGLKVNAGNTKVMAGCCGGKWPCGVRGKGVQATTGQCTVCKKMIHKRRSGVHGDLSRIDNGFRCKRCEGTSQEADLVGGWRDIWMCKEFLLSGRHS